MLMKSVPNSSRTTVTRTSEHVSQGHPDKACDQFADAILDQILDSARINEKGAAKDLDQPNRQRAAIEILAKGFLVIVSGEIRMGPRVAQCVSVADIIKNKWSAIGYPSAEKVTVLNHLQVQSSELQANADREGAGDQGIMVGFATNETNCFMPREYEAARDLCLRIQQLAKEGTAPWLRADAKTQVTLNSEGRVERVIISVHHANEIDGATKADSITRRIKAVLMEHAIEPLLGKSVTADRVIVNGSGSFVVGGTVGDAGVVGRKIVIDAYGPHVPVGGGAYSGKDPSKVDRSAAYMARHIAKTATAMRIQRANSVTVHIAYGIGQQQPEMVTAVTDAGVDISDWVMSRFPDLAPAAIIDRLGLWRTGESSDWRYQDTAAYGHFGRNLFPWEQIADVSD